MANAAAATVLCDCPASLPSRDAPCPSILFVFSSIHPLKSAAGTPRIRMLENGVHWPADVEGFKIQV